MRARHIPACLLAVACGLSLPGAASAQPRALLAWNAIQPIVSPLTYRDMLIARCHVKEASPLQPFMSELKAAGASKTLIAQAKAETARLRKLERKTPAEYICTAELFESTEKNAAEAQKVWAELKTRKP